MEKLSTNACTGEVEPAVIAIEECKSNVASSSTTDVQNDQNIFNILNEEALM